MTSAQICIIIAIAVVYIAIRVPAFLSVSSIVNIISLTAAKLPIALGIGGAALSGYGREADQTVGLFTHLRKDRGPGVFGDVVRHGEGPESSRSFGVHAAFGDHFPVEMGEFFEIPYVLQHGGAAHVGGLDVLVVGNGFPVFGGQSFLVHILSFFVGMQKMPDRFMIEFHIVVIQSKNIAIQTGVASLGICFFCEERTVGANFSGKSTLFFEDLENFTIFVPLTGD